MENVRKAALLFLQPDETVGDFLARVHVEPLFSGIPLIDNRFPLQGGMMLEIAGLAGTGKTEILYGVSHNHPHSTSKRSLAVLYREQGQKKGH
jgi:hypothetical protein